MGRKRNWKGEVMRWISLSALGVLLAAPWVGADTLWSTYGSGYVSAYLSYPFHENAENFVLGSTSQITAAHWSGIYYTFPNNVQTGVITPTADNFSVEIFGDSGGNPGTAPIDVLSGTLVRTDTGTTKFGSELFDYTITLSSPLVLGPGTYYFDPVDNAAPDYFYWAVVSNTGNFWVRDTPNPGTWIENNSNHVPSTMAFSLEGYAVPLPSAAWGGLVLLGGLGLMTVVRRRLSMRV
jgi:hypothetical protein